MLHCVKSRLLRQSVKPVAVGTILISSLEALTSDCLPPGVA